MFLKNKLDLRKKKFLLATIILLPIFLFLFSCGEKRKERVIVKQSTSKTLNKKNTNTFSDKGPVSVVKYNTPTGAIKTVSAENGGNGFEKIAESLGFETNTDFNLKGSSKAKKGGVFVNSFTSYPNSFRTTGKESNTQVLGMIGEMVYEQLLNVDFQTMKYYPSLATHWKISEDKQTFWYRLDPNARWSDGKRVVSADIKATIGLRTDKGILAPSTNETYGKYKVEVISDYIFKVTTTEVNFRLFYYFSGMIIYPNHHLNKIDGDMFLEKYHWKMLPGTGAYVLDEKKTVKGSTIFLRRRSDYWAADKKRNIGLFNFDEYKIVIIRDEVLEKEKFKKGEIDFYGLPSSKTWIKEFDVKDPEPQFDALKRGLVQKTRVYNYKPKGSGGLAFNMRKPPFDDINIRIAFTKLFNRKQLIEKLFYNEYNMLKSTYPGSIYENKDNPLYEFDPKGAAELLDKAGWNNKNSEGYRLNKNGQIFELDLSITQTWEKIMTPLQEDLRNAGIKLNLKITDSNSLWSMINERRFKIHFASWGALFIPNPVTSYHSKYADVDNTNNITGFKNDRVDEICDEYNAMFTAKDRIKVIKELDNIIAKTVHYAYGWTPLWSERMLYWNKFGKPESVVTYSGDWQQVPTLWWYEPELAKKVEAAKSDLSITFKQEKPIADYWNVLKKK